MSGKAGHPAYFDPQTEKAFMKQDGIFANKKELLNKGSKRAPRSVSFLSAIFCLCTATALLHFSQAGQLCNIAGDPSKKCTYVLLELGKQCFGW